MALATIVACAAFAAGTPAGASQSGGGSLTVLQNQLFGDWTGLDPALSVAAGPFMDAIYGDLFEIGPGGKLQPDLATGYRLAKDGRTLTISLRHGVTFSDGTPFDAQAVAFNIRRDANPKNDCTCLANLPVASVSTPNRYTVRVRLTRPFGAIVYAFADGTPGWIVSPTALEKMGTKAFALKPVGAGPFEVVSDVPANKLVLKANPRYWPHGHPELSSLTFETIATDETGYEDLLAGQGQVYLDLTTFKLLDPARQHLTVTGDSGSLGTFVVQLNTTIAPFDNLEAREAIYDATDAAAINKGITGNRGAITESPSEPGGLFYDPRVPGYRGYDLAKAQALVKQLGGMSINLQTGSQEADVEIASVLASQWAQAGIHVTIGDGPLDYVEQEFQGKAWQTFLQQAGGFNPALGVGLTFRFESTGPFSGIHDPKLDQLIRTATSTIGGPAEEQAYKKVFAYISEKAYAPFLFVTPQYNLSTRSVSGPGLTTDQYEIFWQDVKVG